MTARLVLAAPVLAFALAASPAAAEPGSTSRMAEQLRDPATQQAVARAVAAMSEAMLAMPMDPFARAAESMGDRRTARRMRGATLGEYAGRDARAMPREIGRKLPAMMGAMGAMAQAADEMTPALKAMAKELGARMKDAMRDNAGGSAATDDDSIPSAQAEPEPEAPLD